MDAKERSLMQAVQAIAQPEEIQRTLFPRFVAVADQLALDFEEALLAGFAQHNAAWSDSQKRALNALDGQLAVYSGPSHPEIWSEPESLSHEAWTGFRELAAEALAAFGWPEVSPAPSNAVYAGPPDA